MQDYRKNAQENTPVVFHWFFEKFIYPYEIQNKHCLFLYLNFPKNNTEQICFKIFQNFHYWYTAVETCQNTLLDCKPVTKYSNMSFLYPLTVCFLKDNMR